MGGNQTISESLKPKDSVIRVSTTKALEAAAAYTANDVLSETDTNNAGTAWTFPGVVSYAGGKGRIIQAKATSESESVTPRLTLLLFTKVPTSELDDNAANTAPDLADVPYYIGKIDFPAMESLGTTDSNTIATTSTYGNLPIDFKCQFGLKDIYGILVTRDAFTQSATDDMTISIEVEQIDG